MQPNNPVYRRPRSLVAVVVVLVVAIVAFSVFRTRHKMTVVNRVLGPPGLQFPSFAAPRGGVGCYYLKPGDEVWQSVACVPPSEARKLPREQADPTLFAASNGNLAPATTRATSLWEGYVDVVFFNKFSGETDPGWQSNDSWSIQANTNFFTGNNGDTDWVQFVYTNAQPGPPNVLPSVLPTLCVDQEDMNQGNSPNAVQQQCVNTTLQTLSSNFAGYVSATTSGPFFPCPIWRLRHCPADYTLTTIFTAWQGNAGVGSWAVTAPDLNGLSTRWNQISGTIVGTALGTEAVFTSPTLLLSNTGAYGPSLNNVSFTNRRCPSCPPVCPLSTNPPCSPTGETNNLNFLEEAAYCINGGWCYVVTEMGN